MRASAPGSAWASWTFVGGSAASKTARVLQHVRVELGGIRFRIIGGEFGGFVDQVAHGAVDLLQLVLARNPGADQAGADLLDRVVFGAHLLHFLTRAIFGRVR